MKPAAARPARTPRRLHNDHRSRLLLALLTGLPLAVWLAPHIGTLNAALAAWDIGIALYLSLLAVLIQHADDSTSRQRLNQHPHGFSILIWIVVTAMLSLVCVGLIMNMHGSSSHHVVLLCAIAVVLAWLMMHAAFGRYYGQIHHELQQHQVADGGLRFAGEHPPRLIDFYYLSFMVALSYTSGDVVITHHRQRRVLLLQALVAFIFYSTVVTSILSALFFLPSHATL